MKARALTEELCSARLQAGVCLVLRCRPEGRGYKNSNLNPRPGPWASRERRTGGQQLQRLPPRDLAILALVVQPWARRFRAQFLARTAHARRRAQSSRGLVGQALLPVRQDVAR